MNRNKVMTITKKVLHMFSPKAFVQYTIQKMKRDKYLLLALLCIMLVPKCLCLDLSNFDPTNDFNFIGALDDLKVNISSYSFVSSIFGVLLPLGQSLAVLVWMIQLGEVAMRADLTPEHIAGQIMKLCIFQYVLGQSETWMGYIFSFFSYAITKVEGGFTAAGVVVGKDLDPAVVGFDFSGFSDLNFWDPGICIFIEFGIFWLLKLACQVFTGIQVWLRKMKMLLVASVCPLGIYDYIGGTRSTSIKYVKLVLAYGLQGVIMYTVGGLANELLLTSLKDVKKISTATGSGTLDYVEQLTKGNLHFGSFLIAAIPAALAMLFLFNKSEEIAKTCTGA